MEYVLYGGKFPNLGEYLPEVPMPEIKQEHETRNIREVR